MKKLFVLIAITIVILFVVSSCSLNHQMVVGRYTVEDVVSAYKLETLPKDTLVLKMNGTALLEARDTTIVLGKWGIDDGQYYINYHEMYIPFNRTCDDNQMVLLFNSSIYRKAYKNDKGVLKPLKP